MDRLKDKKIIVLKLTIYLLSIAESKFNFIDNPLFEIVLFGLTVLFMATDIYEIIKQVKKK